MSRKLGRVILATTLLFLIAGAPVLAQGTQSGTIRGSVEMGTDGTAVPGVLVTAVSPALQGTRTVYTGIDGAYILRNLMPGEYIVTFELDGMDTTQSAATVSLGQSTPVNVALQLATQGETVVVTGELPSVISSSQVSTVYTAEEVHSLPLVRTPAGIAAIAPGLTTNTPNAGQLTISGGFAYDNVFLIDGVDANDNLFGTTNPVFIEAAIADLQVLTSGISAEYGRFSGGVVNVITKSGGNRFSGSFRIDMENPDWRERTPLEIENETTLNDDISKFYSATFGGYIPGLQDNLWFFLSGRDEESSEQRAYFLTGLPMDLSVEETRYEYKLTGNIGGKHQIQGTYTETDNANTRPSQTAVAITPDTVRDRENPAKLVVGRYSGVLTSSLFAELQYSEKEFAFINSHGVGASEIPSTDPSFVSHTPFWGYNSSALYNAPYWDGTDPEDRNNEQLAASLSWFVDSDVLGSHDLKIGYEDYLSLRTGGNSQSPTSWTGSADPKVDAGGNVILDSNGKAIPVWDADAGVLWYNFIANRDAKVELNTISYYVNDTWQLNDNFSFNLGFRYEDVSGQSDAGTTVVNTDAFVPRLAAAYDVKGDGKHRFDITYAEYAGKYSESQFASNTDVGNPALLYYWYVGPFGEGFDFAPGFDVFNTNYWELIGAQDGTQNVFQDPNITSPTSREFTLAYGMQLARGGYLKAIFTDREYDDFVEDFITTETGTTNVVVEGVDAGTFSNQVFSNQSVLSREYQAIQLIGRYRLTDVWTLDGNYTYQIKNEGSFEGEGRNTPGSSSIFGNYPEMLSADRHYPTGRLNDFQEHKLRVWTNYTFDWDRYGDLGFGLLMNYDSGTTGSLTDGVSRTAIQTALLNQAGYVDRPSSTLAYFDKRGSIDFASLLTFDLSINYLVPIWKDLGIGIKADIINLLDEDKLVTWDIEITDDPNGPVDELGMPTTYTENSNFGNAENNASYPQPREYRLAFFLRF